MIGPYLELCNFCFKTREMESREGRSVLEGRLEVALKEAEQVNLLPLLAFFLDAIASPSTYPCQSVGEWVSE